MKKSNPEIISILLIGIVLFFLGCNSPKEQIFVSPNGKIDNLGTVNSPFKNIQLAIEKAKKIKLENGTTQVEIHLLEGEYRLASPLEITPELNGTTITGEGVDKTVVKGSKILNLNWEKHDENIWVSKVKEGVIFDQVFINNIQQILARYPNYNEEGGHWQGHAEDALDLERIKSWKNPVGTTVHAMHSGEWGDFHFEISKVNEDGTAEFIGGHQNNRPSKMHLKYRMVENVLEELDSPGEWYLEKSTNLFYYWPTKSINLENAVVEVVVLKSLIEIVGTEEDPVKEIGISGIKFEHTQRTFMEKYEPLLRSDWTMYRGGALFIEGSENVTIADCEFVNLGGNVIFVSNYNRKFKLTGSHIHECGATAISFVGNPSAVRSPSFQYDEFVPLSELDTVKGPANNDYPNECLVDNNLIYRVGRVEKQIAGVQISMAMNITVSNNSIYDLPRSGINVSEGTWGGHIIEYNDVFNTVLESSDHGSFNSWGRDRFWHPNRTELDKITTDNPDMPNWDAIHTTIIRNNRFRCDHGWDIDLDDGSSNYKIYNNVCLKGGIKLREGFYRTVENNILINNSFHPHVWFKKSGDVFRKNIVMTDYKDIRLQGWGKEIDYNLFPNQEALDKARKNETDEHSTYGNPEFTNAEEGDYSVLETSPALKLGFVNFPMDNFGVKKASLKTTAKTPEIPVIWSITESNNKSLSINLLGGTFKNIETLEERSASGLSKTAGVLLTAIGKNSVIAKSGLLVGDVIVWGEEKEINTIPDLMNIYEGNNWKGKLSLKIFRNQKKESLVLETKNKSKMK
ncbi:MAG: PDZ domain-containing protein [Cellulophaga sp.]